MVFIAKLLCRLQRILFGTLFEEFLELRIKSGMFRLERARPFEERLCCNGKKLDRVRRSVSIENRRNSSSLRYSQRVELCAHHSRPCDVLCMTIESGRSISGPVLEVELMRELMQNHILPVTWITRAVTCSIPRKNECSESVGC